MTRPMLDTPPMYSFTEAQLRAAHKVAEPWSSKAGELCQRSNTLFWEMAVSALLDRTVTDEDVERFRPLIRQAIEEAGA